MIELTSIYKLLSDETRLRIILLLAQDKLCVCQMSGIIDAPQPRISKNLAKLRDLNLVSDQRQDKFIYYTLNTQNKVLLTTLQTIMDNIDDYPQLLSDRQQLSTKQCFISGEDL